MQVKTFKQGGVHPPEFKDATASRPIRNAALPPLLVIPLHQHTGAPCQPLVKVGDRVLAGDKLGEADGLITASVHASASGEVIAIEPRQHFNGQRVLAVVIKTDAAQVQAQFTPPDPAAVTPDAIRAAAREAGLVGMGGAAFPTAVKLAPPPGKPIDAVIANGCECEPYLTCDHRLMLEHADALLSGLRLAMTAVGAKHGYIGIEANKPDAIALLSDKADGNVSVLPLEVKYPEGAEKQLIQAVLGREVPPGKLPSEVGALVQNVGTLIALHEAVFLGKPLIERVVTVSGPGVVQPDNLRVKIGTPISHLFADCGGLTGHVARVVMGGPMTGWAQPNLDSPVVKGTSGLLALTAEVVPSMEGSDCVRCGRCAEVCPMRLLPNYISVTAAAGLYDLAERWGAIDCFECAACAYVCPANRPIIHLIRQTKAEISARRRREPK